MNRVTNPPAFAANIDRPLIFSWLLLLGFGFVMVASSSVAIDPHFFTRHSVYLGIALVGFLVMLAIRSPGGADAGSWPGSSRWFSAPSC